MAQHLSMGHRPPSSTTVTCPFVQHVQNFGEITDVMAAATAAAAAPGSACAPWAVTRLMSQESALLLLLLLAPALQFAAAHVSS